MVRVSPEGIHYLLPQGIACLCYLLRHLLPHLAEGRIEVACKGAESLRLCRRYYALCRHRLYGVRQILPYLSRHGTDLTAYRLHRSSAGTAQHCLLVVAEDGYFPAGIHISSVDIKVRQVFRPCRLTYVFGSLSLHPCHAHLLIGAQSTRSAGVERQGFRVRWGEGDDG